MDVERVKAKLRAGGSGRIAIVRSFFFSSNKWVSWCKCKQNGGKKTSNSFRIEINWHKNQFSLLMLIGHFCNRKLSCNGKHVAHAIFDTHKFLSTCSMSVVSCSPPLSCAFYLYLHPLLSILFVLVFWKVRNKTTLQKKKKQKQNNDNNKFWIFERERAKKWTKIQDILWNGKRDVVRRVWRGSNGLACAHTLSGAALQTRNNNNVPIFVFTPL